MNMELKSMSESGFMNNVVIIHAIPYIANCSRWKSFDNGQGTSSSLEKFCSLFTPFKMCSHAYEISLIECICLVILNNYMYRLTCCFLSQPRGHVKSY